MADESGKHKFLTYNNIRKVYLKITYIPSMKIKRCLRMNDCCRKTKRSGGRLRETLCQRAATNYLEPIRINAKMQSILK
ncbi:uncharacterized protein Dvar_63620 [Desulfosarcina variabilis str. Montpellier]